MFGIDGRMLVITELHHVLMYQDLSN